MMDSKHPVLKDLLRLAGRGLTFLVIGIGTYLLLLFILTNIKVTGNPLIYRASQSIVQKGGFTYERFREFDPGKKYDILAFGSSRVNRGINPRIFEEAGYSCYNLGTDDQTPVNTEVLVKHFVKPGQCRLVILDVFDKIFSHGPLESAADLIQNTNDDKIALQIALAAEDVRAINLLGTRMMMKNASPSYKGDTKLYKGYRYKMNEKNDFSGDGYLYKTNKNNLRDFEEIIRYLQSINIPFILVCQPMPEYVNHGNQKMLLKDLQPILTSTNTEIHDYAFGHNILDINDFSDESHLTMHGADKYSRFLVSTLINKIIQPGVK